MTAAASEWRRGLSRLATALIVYGVIGLLVTGVGIAALVAASGRIYIADTKNDRIVAFIFPCMRSGVMAWRKLTWLML